MKILVSEKQLKFLVKENTTHHSKNNLDELGGQYKEQVEIICRDENMVCLIPKSQMTSKIYGQGTEWCQTRKSGFEKWSKEGLLIRFLFKDGTKIRLTYFFNPTPAYGSKQNGDLYDFYWATEKMQHLFHGNGDAFDFSKFTNDAEKRLGKNIISKLSVITEDCKNKVRDFIKKNKTNYNYCYSSTEYKTPKETKQKPDWIIAAVFGGTLNGEPRFHPADIKNELIKNGFKKIDSSFGYYTPTNYIFIKLEKNKGDELYSNNENIIVLFKGNLPYSASFNYSFKLGSNDSDITSKLQNKSLKKIYNSDHFKIFIDKLKKEGIENYYMRLPKS